MAYDRNDKCLLVSIMKRESFCVHEAEQHVMWGLPVAIALAENTLE
jgi:hypothetical protein